jgi:hypothetical protein
MPCTWVKYCVLPPILMFMTCLRPSKVGFCVFHWIKSLEIFSITSGQGVKYGTSFPTHAPRTQQVCWSDIILRSPGICVDVGLILRSRTTCSRYSGELNGKIIVFFVLNFAVDVVHHRSRTRQNMTHTYKCPSGRCGPQRGVTVVQNNPPPL